MRGTLKLMKGIILAGGTGSRLWPNTLSTSKQLLQVYDKPLIYYPLSTLMLAGINEILIITTPEDEQAFKKLLGDGSKIGVSLQYISQAKPEGIAQAFIIGEKFIADESIALILGDNIFHGVPLEFGNDYSSSFEGAQIFGSRVVNPKSYGIAELNADGNVVSIEEKPLKPKSDLAIPGIYLLDASASEKAHKTTKSLRGELEITSVLEMYLVEKNLKLIELPRGTCWMDCGTVSGLNDAGNYVRAIQERQGVKIACIEEIALGNGWITTSDVLEIVKNYGKNEYAAYLTTIIKTH